MIHLDPESTPTYPDVSVAVSPIEPRRSPRKTRQGKTIVEDFNSLQSPYIYIS
jgi:hypothetical protein